MERPPQLGRTYFRRAAMFERAFVATRHRHAPLVIPHRRRRLFPLSPVEKMIAESAWAAGRVCNNCNTQRVNHASDRREICHRKIPRSFYVSIRTTRSRLWSVWRPRTRGQSTRRARYIFPRKARVVSFAIVYTIPEPQLNNCRFDRQTKCLPDKARSLYFGLTQSRGRFIGTAPPSD